MRQIFILTAVGGADFAWAPGEVVELDDDQAASWADGERARYLEPGDFMLQHQALTDDEAEQLKARWLEGAATAQPVVLADEQTAAYVFDLLDAWASGEPLDFHGHPVPEDVQARVTEVLGPVEPAASGPPPRTGAGSGRDAWAAYAEAHEVQVDEDMRRDDIIAACAAADVPISRPAGEEV